MKALKCEVCASNELVKDGDYFVCSYCGTKYTLEDAKKMLVSGEVEIIKGDAEKERLLKNAMSFIKISEFERARSTYAEVVEEFPEDYRGWWGLFSLQFRIYYETGVFSPYNIDAKHLQNVKKLCDDPQIVSSLFDEIIADYGVGLRLARVPSTISYYDADLRNYNSEEIKCIDSFTYWLIYESASILGDVSENFVEFVKNLANLFAQSVKDGDVFPYISSSNFSITDPVPFYEGTWTCNLSKTPAVVKLIAGKMGCKFSVDNFFSDADKTYAFSKGIRKVSGIRSFEFMIGRWVYSRQCGYILLDKELHDKDLYMTDGRCFYCGGEFQGLFKKVCSVCGKPKNY